MANVKRSLSNVILTMILIVIVTVNFNTTTVIANNEQIIINNAAATINQAFNNLLAVEKAGGNISQLLNELNEAGLLLADAKNSYRNNNLSSVITKAQEAREIAIKVNNETLNMRFVSLIGTQDSLWLTLVFSVVSAIIFTVLLLLIWRRFKRDYISKLLDMKPEVIDNAA